MPFLAPIVTAVTGFIGSLGFIGKALIGIGLNLLVGKLKSKKSDQPAVAGTQFERQYGENTSRKAACGRVGMAGHDCYVNTYGSANKLIEQVYAFSDFPCDALVKVWAGGTKLPLSLTGDYGSVKSYSVASGDYAGLIEFNFYDGSHTTADALLITNSNPVGRWTADHIGTGVCYVIVRMIYDQDKLNSPPDFFFELRGARLYDIRKDSTVGGAGGHRWGDYSTYEFTENPVVMEYNYRRGFTINDDMFLGMGMIASDLPFDRYAAAMNICDESAAYGTRYRCSVIFDADNVHGDNIEAVMTACGGIVIDSVEGSWPLIGTDQPIVATFTDDDLIADEPVRFQRRRSMMDLVNSVSGTYPEPGNLWSPVGYDEQTDPAYVALDRRSRDIALDLGTVPYKAQANQLASIYFNENRYEATADVVLRPRFRTVQAGDWVRWNSARYGNRVYMVQARSIMAMSAKGPRNVSLSLQERDGGIYASTTVIPPTIPIPPGEPVYLNELQDFAIIPVIGSGADGRSYPAFRLSWSPIEDPTVTGIIFEWWITTEPANVFTRTGDASQTISFVQEGIVSLTQYQFRYKLIADRPTSYVGPFTVTSLDGGNGDIEVGLGNLKQDVLDTFADLYSGFDDVRPLLEQIMINMMTSTAQAETARRRLAVTVGNNRAAFDEQVVVVADELTAISEQITDVEALTAEGFAQGRIRFSAISAPSGVLARFSVQLRVTVDDAFKDTGFYLEAYEDTGVVKSRFAVMADQFVVTDGSETSLPMVYEGGVLKLQVANIGTVTAGLITSPTGKMAININAGTIEIFS